MSIWAIIFLAGSVLVGYLGRDRRIGFLGFFLSSLLLTPLLTLLILILTAPRKTKHAA